MEKIMDLEKMVEFYKHHSVYPILQTDKYHQQMLNY